MKIHKAISIFILKLGIFCTLYAQNTPNFPQLFQQQLQVSCKQSFNYQKTLHNLQNPTTKPEIQNLKLDATKNDYLKDELAYSFEFDASDTKRKADYTQTQQKDTLIFNRIPNSTAELVNQKILYQNQKIRYIESSIIKKYWLYTMEMHIKVYFDEKGTYTQHFLRMYSKIALLDAFDTFIQGKKT